MVRRIESVRQPDVALHLHEYSNHGWMARAVVTAAWVVRTMTASAVEMVVAQVAALCTTVEEVDCAGGGCGEESEAGWRTARPPGKIVR